MHNKNNKIIKFVFQTMEFFWKFIVFFYSWREAIIWKPGISLRIVGAISSHIERGMALIPSDQKERHSVSRYLYDFASEIDDIE